MLEKTISLKQFAEACAETTHELTKDVQSPKLASMLSMFGMTYGAGLCERLFADAEEEADYDA